MTVLSLLLERRKAGFYFYLLLPSTVFSPVVKKPVTCIPGTTFLRCASRLIFEKLYSSLCHRNTVARWFDLE